MDHEEKIEFYKNRSLGERLSAAAEFLRQNGVVMYKNILIPAIPLVFLEAYFLLKYMEAIPTLASGSGSFLFALQGMLLILVSMLLSLFLYSMSGAVLSRYEEGLLTKDTGWGNLSHKMFSNAGKTILIGLAMSLIIIVVALTAGFLFYGIGMLVGTFIIFLFVLVMLAAFLPLVLILYPAYFQNASTFESIKKGYALGFKNWGTTFLTLLILIVMSIIVALMFAGPYYVYTIFNLGTNSIIVYLLAVLLSFSNVFTTPFIFVFFAFQYFAIAEKEEGISLQNKVDSFDNL